ncbi:MAG: hypothetical protein IJ834_05260 [Paludibacteraceae bacterium]|nr:hypothetical protein [Paludibacteraceae bacterium]
MKKKLFVAALFVAMVAGVSAQNYNYSVGGTVGSMYGASFKGFFLPIDKLGLQVDLGVNLMSTSVTTTVRSGGSKMTASGTWDGVYTFEVNPNLLYQDNIASWGFGDLSWYAGGGLSIGFIDDIKNSGNPMFKWGLNAAGGLELGFAAVPLALSFDFRPGYGMGVNSSNGVSSVSSFFDWKLVAGLRYIF